MLFIILLVWRARRDLTWLIRAIFSEVESGSDFTSAVGENFTRIVVHSVSEFGVRNTFSRAKITGVVRLARWQMNVNVL